MITLDECWKHYDRSSTPVPLDGQSYGLEQLDVLLEAHLPQESGFFIEIGAFDGVTQSNSLRLESRGWKGLLVEATPGSYAKCVKSRPGCIVEHAACVSETYKEQTLTITDVGLMSVADTSAFDKEMTSAWIDRGAGFAGRAPQELDVPVSTLSGILDVHEIKQVDLLILDVEGSEVEVLSGIDFSKHAPSFILAEDAYDSGVESLLSANGYVKKAVLLARKYTRDQLYVRQGYEQDDQLN